MSNLTKCPYCQMDVPSNAEICGHCRKRLKMSFGTKFILGLIGFVILLSVIGNLTGPTASTAPTAQSQYTPPPPPVEEALTVKGKKIKEKHKGWSNQDCNIIGDGRIFVGMTTEQARVAWGKPETINSSGGASGSREQWCYPGNNYIYFREGKLTNWQVSE